jgi:hypothetical protein
MPFNGFSQQAYAQKMIDEYKVAGVHAALSFPPSKDTILKEHRYFRVIWRLKPDNHQGQKRHTR